MHREVPLKTLLSELPCNFSEEEYLSCMSFLPAWRRKQAEAFRHMTDKMQCAKVYLLLCQLLNEYTGKAITPRFSYGNNGKPYLPDYPHIHFNMSHCHRAVICTINSKPVGCDVEEIPDSLDKGVLDYCFSPEEQATILHSEKPEIEFTRQWTRKEALLKLHGIGLIDDLPGLMHSHYVDDSVCFDTIVCAEHGYVYTICSKP